MHPASVPLRYILAPTIQECLSKGLKAIPLKCIHQEGRGLFLSPCEGVAPGFSNCQLANAAVIIGTDADPLCDFSLA